MTHSLPLKQVLALLEEGLHHFKDILHPALCLWLQSHAAVHQRKPNEHAEAALHAVQTAELSLRFCKEEDKLLWMGQHIQSVSDAFTEYVQAQTGTALKRLLVLKQLLAFTTGPKNEQFPARFQEELNLGCQMLAAIRIATVISPVATLIIEFFSVKRLILHGHNGPHLWTNKARNLERGRVFLEEVSRVIAHNHQCAAVHDHDIQQALQSIKGLTTHVTEDVVNALRGCIKLRLQASMAWMRMALLLPASDCPDCTISLPCTCIALVGWSSFRATDCDPSDVHQIQADMQKLLCCVLARPDLRSTAAQSGHVHDALATFGVQPQHLRNAGVPAAVLQQHISWLKNKGAADQHAVVTNTHDTHSRQTVSIASIADDDTDLDDMNALVQLMCVAPRAFKCSRACEYE